MTETKTDTRRSEIIAIAVDSRLSVSVSPLADSIRSANLAPRDTPVRSHATARDQVIFTDLAEDAPIKAMIPG